MLAFCVSPVILAVHLATLNFVNSVANPLPKGRGHEAQPYRPDAKESKADEQGTHEDVWDSGFPGFGVRVSDTGRRTFILAARYPGSSNPTRRALGVYDKISLEDAREKARAWHKLVAKGIDPESAEEVARQAALRTQGNTFQSVCEEFLSVTCPRPARREGRKGTFAASLSHAGLTDR